VPRGRTGRGKLDMFSLNASRRERSENLKKTWELSGKFVQEEKNVWGKRKKAGLNGVAILGGRCSGNGDWSAKQTLQGGGN